MAGIAYSFVVMTTSVSDNPLTSGATTINLGTTIGILPGSNLIIDSECITVGTVNSPTQLINCVRAAQGSTATSHLLNAAVGNGVSFDYLPATNSGYITNEWSTTAGSRVTTQLIPRSDIGQQQNAGRDTTKHSLKVYVMGTSVSDFRSRLHFLLNNMVGISAQIFKNNDKFWFGSLKSFPYVLTSSDIQQRTLVSLEFECNDPFLYHANSAITTTWNESGNGVGAVSDTQTANNTGEVYAGFGTIGPIYTLTGPFGSGITLTNTSTGQSFTINQPLPDSTNIWVIDVGARVVSLSTNSGATFTETYNNFTGDSISNGFVPLLSGSNALALTGPSGTGTMTMTFVPRDLGVD